MLKPRSVDMLKNIPARRQAVFVRCVRCVRSVRWLLPALVFAAVPLAQAGFALPELGFDAERQAAGAALFAGSCSENLQPVRLAVHDAASGRRLPLPEARCTGGVWQLAAADLAGADAAALASLAGRIELTAVHADRLGRQAGLMVSFLAGSVDARVLAVGIDAPTPIHAGNRRPYVVSGACSVPGERVVLALRDGQGRRFSPEPAAQPLCRGGRWRHALDLPAWPGDGLLTLDVRHASSAGLESWLSASVWQDTHAPALSIDPLLFVHDANQTSLAVSGACSEAHSPVLLRVQDSRGASVSASTRCSGTGWSAAALDLSALADGELAFRASYEPSFPESASATQAGVKATTPKPAPPEARGTLAVLLEPALQDRPRTGGQGAASPPGSLATAAGSPQVSAASVASAVSVVSLAKSASGDAARGTPAIAAGARHSLAIKADGSVWAWGSHERGQLGDGQRAALRPLQSTPVRVGGLTAVAVGAGAAHSVALTTSGSVFSWGANESGQLGTGTASTAETNRPVALGGSVPLFSEIAVGAHHTLALSAAGAVWAWGANGDGQIGQSTAVPFDAQPRQIIAGGVRAIAAGARHSLALMENGEVYAWGRGVTGATAATSTPQKVAGLANVSAIAAGGEHSLALKDGGIWAWGANWTGQLGDGGSSEQPLPVAVRSPDGAAPLAGVAAIRAGDAFSLALKTDGSVLAWGYGAMGPVGKAGWKSLLPRQIANTGPSSSLRVVALAAGDHHALALTAGGGVLAWGYNGYGQLGDGALTYRQDPLDPGLSDVAALHAGGRHVVTKRNVTGPSARAWGANWRGQIDPDYPFQYQPSADSEDSLSMVFDGAAAVAAGYAHTLKLAGTPAVTTAYGDNGSGQLGLNLGAGYKKLAAGGRHSLAIGADDRVLAWGSNESGQLGRAGDSSATPVTVQGTQMSGAVAEVAAGAAHSLAISNGAVWAWGSNLFGQIGPGGGSGQSATPVAVAALAAGATRVAAGWQHSVALVDGEVWTWGRNAAGQLGNASTSDSAVPVRVLDKTKGVTGIAAGAQHTLAINAVSGELWSWGNNVNGQLGNASTQNVALPALLSTLYPGAEIAAGADYSLVRTASGRVKVFGGDADGQLGWQDVLGSKDLVIAAIRPDVVPALLDLGNAAAPNVTLAQPANPVLSGATLFTGTASAGSQLKWSLLRSTAPHPDLQQIHAGQDGLGNAADFSGTASIGSGVFSLTAPAGLSVPRAYRLFVCVVQDSASSCYGNAASVDFTTASPPGSTRYSVSVSLAGDAGAGFVAGTPESLDGAALYCGSGSCTRDFAVGQSVSLRAFAGAGATFTGWSGGCSGSADTCSVSASAAVVATFSRPGAAGGTVGFSPVSGVPAGRSVSLTLNRSANTDAAATVRVLPTGSDVASCSFADVGFVPGQSQASLRLTAKAGCSGAISLTLSGSGVDFGSNSPVNIYLRKRSGGTPWEILLLD